MSTQEEISPIANQPSVPPPSYEKELASSSSSNNNHVLEKEDGELQRKKKFGELGGVALIFACGSALFSDGYVNAIAGPVNTIIKGLYKDRVSPSTISNFTKTFPALAFAGTILGMLVFGVLSDKIGRKFGMLFASSWLILWSILSAGAYGAGGSIGGLLAALQAYRFLIGIAIGAEYPAGSVACSENSEAKTVPKRWQNGFFVLATNSAIDVGFVAASVVVYVCSLIWPNNLGAAWRVSLGLGAVPPFTLLFFRAKMQEPEHFQKNAMKKVSVPWWLIVKRYWVKISAVSLAWFIYDYVAYPAGIYSSFIVGEIIGENASLQESLKWGIVINAFYLPGTFFGAFFIDLLGPKKCMLVGLACQAAIGFGMAAGFGHLKQNIAGFAVIYGFFLAFGEFGAGNNLGLLASKSVAPTAVRGSIYGLVAAIGKVGAFSGSYAYTEIQNDLDPTMTKDIYYAGPFYIAAGLACLSFVVILCFVPEVKTDGMAEEDEKFRVYLAENGFDVDRLGLPVEHDDERQNSLDEKKEKDANGVVVSAREV